jgi:nucleoid-associated protein YgaU
MADAKNKGNSGSNDGLALIIGGLFVLALVFATYSYFNRSEPLDEEVSGDSTERMAEDESAAADKSLGDRIRELFNSESTDEGDLNGNGATTTTQPSGEMENEGETESVFAQWVATDYQQGDISGSSYTVKSGDTLWEIAEARYGNGADWTKILDANSSDIGYLPNGQQALIVPGQTLVLP